MNPPDVSYARSGDVAVAYQVVGVGPADIVFVRGITGDLLSTWEQPMLVRHVEGLAALGRVLMLDKRGTGLSDRVREVQRGALVPFPGATTLGSPGAAGTQSARASSTTGASASSASIVPGPNMSSACV